MRDTPTDKYAPFGNNWMFEEANPYSLNCPSRKALDLIGGKWPILLLCSLQHGPVRTGELARRIAGISPKMLTQTLRKFESHGIVERISYHEVPPRVEYQLTDLGRSLSELGRAMEQWVVKNYAEMVAHQSRSFEDGEHPSD